MSAAPAAPEITLSPVASRPAPPRCRLCGAGGLAPLFAVGGGFELRECRSCGLVSTAPELGPAEIAAYYPTSYYGEENRRFNPLFERLIRVFRQRRVRAIECFVRRGRMLDVGCGRGLVPLLMRQRGWEAHGVELSEAAARHARDRAGLPVFVGDFLDSGYPGASFDVVVFWHVLEHMADPAAVLAEARRIMAPGGLLVVAVPNFESLQARAGGRHWFHLDVPRHYHHFRRSTLRRLLAASGFRVVDERHLSLEQNPYGWIQSLLNRLGFRHNLLYDLLKHESARSARPLAAHPLQTLATIALLPVIVPLGMGLTLLEVALRRGGTIEVYARRDDGGSTDATT